MVWHGMVLSVCYGMVWYGMVEVCEGAPVAMVLADRHDLVPHAAICSRSDVHAWPAILSF